MNHTESFALLIQRQSAFVFRVAYAVLHHLQDAEDVAQETFLKLHRSGRWRHIHDERAYLARIVWRLAVTRRARRQTSALMPDVASTSPNPEESAAEADWNARIHRLIDTLPDEFRDPLLLSLTDELTSADIAAILNIPEGTVRNRLFRSRQLLKQKLKFMLEPRHER